MERGKVTYTLARLPIALSFLGHGLVRLPKLSQFSQGMVNGFEETMLPLFIVKPFSLVLPFVELLLGITLLMGLKMKISSITGVILICILIFGSAFQENWSAISIQMFYGIYLAGLYYFSDYNSILFNK